MSTGIEDYYVLKDGRKLRFGYTTGTCAAAAAKAAAMLLLTGKTPDKVNIDTPKGIKLDLDVLNAKLTDDCAMCAVRKYSGDDPDVTDGILVYASVRRADGSDITVEGGRGVGRVTKPGLKRAVGEAAINPAPLDMIRQNVREAMDSMGAYGGMYVEITVPGGEEIARRTFNPNLGITGGISILGTSGIVEPMSEDALTESIELEIKQKRELGESVIVLTPGNYGEDYLTGHMGIAKERIVKCSNYVGKSLDFAVNAGFTDVLIFGHVGKLIKLAGGIMNTHSREGDCRAEIMASCFIRAGGDADTARSILDCVTTDEMLRILDDNGMLDDTIRVVRDRIEYSLSSRLKGQIDAGCAIFSEQYGILLSTENADNMIRLLQS